MYTYDSFVANGSFTLLRPVFIIFIIISIILFILISIPKINQKYLNAFSVISLSLVSSTVSIQLVFYHAIIVDEINLGGDELSITMCLMIIALSVLNPFMYFRKK